MSVHFGRVTAGTTPEYGWPSEPPRKGRAGPIMLVLVLVVGVLAGAGFAVTRSSGHSYPKQWDPRIKPIAAEVEQLRGLTYKHAVPVHFLSGKAFEQAVGVDAKLSAKDRAEFAQEAGIFRALGLLNGDVNLVKALDVESKSSTLAYYDFHKKEIVVRGTKIDVSHRVTLAHELTHVLQDQYFDINKLEDRASKSDTGDESALRAIIEGDAVRIEDKYKAKLSKAERQAYDVEQAAEGSRVSAGLASVPQVLQFLEAAPYEFGPLTLKMLEKLGGNQRINDAFKRPTPSTRLFVQPAFLDQAARVDPPARPTGTSAAGDPETFGPFETYLVLSSRIDALRALEAADVVDGGRAVAYRKGSQLCYAIALQPDVTLHQSFLKAAFAAWARKVPSASVTENDQEVLITACDPGSRARGESDTQFSKASTLLEARAGITESIVENGLSLNDAWCIARVFVRADGMFPLIVQVGNGQPNAEQTDQIRAALLASRDRCAQNPDAGLP
jgi:hypothetical protein